MFSDLINYPIVNNDNDNHEIIQIRPLVKEDIEQIVIARKYQEQENGNGATEEYLKQYAKKVEQLLEESSVIGAGAFNENELISLAFFNLLSYGKEKKLPYLCGVWTNPQYRGKGLATKVNDKLLEGIAERSGEMQEGLLLTVEGTDAAYKLYDKEGYKNKDGEMSFCKDIISPISLDRTQIIMEYGDCINKLKYGEDNEEQIEIGYSVEQLFPHPSNISGKMSRICYIKVCNSDLTLSRLKEYIGDFLSKNRFCKFNINELLTNEPQLYRVFEVENKDTSKVIEKLEELSFIDNKGQTVNIKRSASVMENTIQNALKHTNQIKKGGNSKMGFKILELTKENKDEYVDQVADLEVKVLEAMEKQGKVGQLFTTGKEDISEYIESEENSVYIALDDNNNVISAMYMTKRKKPYTYNDITKYYKCGDDYKRYVREQYSSEGEYKSAMLKAYEYKMQAYKSAKQRILQEHPEHSTMLEFLQSELNSENGFDEKSVLREKLNRYMSEFIGNIKPDDSLAVEPTKLYDQFYWTTAEDISEEFHRTIDMDMLKDPEIREYEELLRHEQLIIHDKTLADQRKYYTANTSNSIEIDTYITDPDNRHFGIARILVYEGLKKYLSRHFDEQEQDDVFLCSTLHRANLSSKYVSEFFGLTDNVFVKRRNGRDREVHMCRIAREEKEAYLDKMENKFITLYDYNPNGKEITSEAAEAVIKEQIAYEQEQYDNLTGIKKTSKTYTGISHGLDEVKSKFNKIYALKFKLIKLRKKPDVADDSERIRTPDNPLADWGDDFGDK